MRSPKASSRAAALALLLIPAAASAWTIDLGPLDSREPDLTAVVVIVTARHVIVSRPFLPSHCGAVQRFEGRATAYSRRTGKRAWRARIPQSTGDQAAFLRAWTDGSRVVFATNGAMVALDRRGRRLWRHDRAPGPKLCRDGPTSLHADGFAQNAGRLLWKGEDAQPCTLSLKTGRVSRAHTPPPAPPTACTITRPEDGHLLGAACHNGRAYRAIARCDDDDKNCRLLLTSD